MPSSSLTAKSLFSKRFCVLSATLHLQSPTLGMFEFVLGAGVNSEWWV